LPYLPKNIKAEIMNLKSGQVAVIRTDTLYGLVARVSDQEAVEKVYTLKGRDFTKPCIVLVADKEVIGEYGNMVADVTKKYQGQPVTVVVPKTNEPEWITRGGNSVAYRITQDEALREFLKETGSIIAPSANPQGLLPASNIAEAKEYFGDRVDIYIDGGLVPDGTKPSVIVEVQPDGSEKIMRAR
jgi:L-threonylcarbamoyladenylate synthase